MTIRTTQAIVHFSTPFRLPGFDAVQPAGDYRVDHDEEIVEGQTLIAWRRLGAFIHLPAIGKPSLRQQMVPVTADELHAALEQDRARP
jgi:hypothetical protein